MVDAKLTGGFPRSEKLVAATRAAVRGNLSQVNLTQVLEEDVRSLASLQEHAGLNALIDGQLNWQDLFRPFSEVFTGIEPGGLVRWFDNNTFYRRPIITQKVSYRGDKLKHYFRVDLLPKGARKKAILPGPFTFALMSENRTHRPLPDLVDDLAHSMREAVKTLRALGYEDFQYDEPCLCESSRTQSDFQIAKQGLETCAQGKGLLHTYFGDAGRSIDQFLDYPVEALGVDLYSTPLDSLKGRSCSKALVCGCVDGRNSLLESPNQLSEIVQQLRDELQPPNITIAPNCSLEFLPHAVAEKKVDLLGKARKLVP
jgi:5-methyltetrahydropteroyltriglutamate--homocysteine methyltransferase